jgi:deoxyribonuclease-4
MNIGPSITIPLNKTFLKKIKQKTLMNCLQIMFFKQNISDYVIKDIKDFIKKMNYEYIFIHASYQINIGTEPIITEKELYYPNLDFFITQIKQSIEIKANGIIIHMGKNVKKQYDNDNIYNNMVNFIIQLFENVKSNNILKKNKNFMILFETPAGQGGELCWNIASIVEFILLFKKTHFYNNIGLCIDTCHIFQAGYNLNDEREIKKIHKILHQVKDKIKVIHLNDSIYPFNSKLDRHAKIGEGCIKIDKLMKFIYPYRHLPFILETTPPYERQIKKINNNI